MLELDSHLTLRSHVVGYRLTVADLAVWGALRGNKVAYAAIKKGAMLNVSRWFKYIEETNAWTTDAVHALNAQAQEKKSAMSKAGGSYDIALPDTEKGVVTRFPPEPSYVVPKHWLTSAAADPLQRLSSHWSCESRYVERLLCT